MRHLFFIMAKEKRQYKFSNSSAIASATYWYPLVESNKPTDLEIEQYFPLKSFVVENKSSQPITVILDPAGGTSSKEFVVPNGKTLNLENKDEIYFHQFAVKNNGVLAIAISEISFSVRNY